MQRYTIAIVLYTIYNKYTNF